MMKIMFVVFMAVATMAGPVHFDHLTEEINKLIDKAVNSLEKSKSFDPMKVPEHTEKFERHVGLLDFKGELLIHNIEIRGLKKLHRQGNVAVKSEDGIVKAHLLLGIHDDTVSIESDVNYKMGNMHPSVHVISDIQDFVIETSVEISQDGNLTLTSFEVRQFASVVNHISGLSILNPVFGVLSDVLTIIFNDFVRDEMTKVLAPAFKRELEQPHQF